VICSCEILLSTIIIVDIVNISNVMTHVEHFPNEILLKIFKYMSINDLHDGFYNLNYRFNAIIQLVDNLSLILTKPDDVNDSVVSLFASRIHHLIVEHSHAIDFARFPALRSLTLMLPLDQQLHNLRAKYLPNLTHLTLGFRAVWNSEKVTCLCQQLFANKFPNLRYCSLWPPVMNDFCSIKQTPSLVHIQLKECNFDDVCAVLNTCPNLIYLQVE
jgi:hypothetical protein